MQKEAKIKNSKRHVMSSKFITNQEWLLSDVINNIIPESKGMYFLVGYFYFSGFFELYKKLKDKQVKVLVGLEVERELGNRLKEYYLIQEEHKRKPVSEMRQEYFKSLRDLINETNFCDTAEKQEAFRIFLQKIKEGTLELKKTAEPNHAKLYVFESDTEHSRGGELPGTVITGSSNLTVSGLRNRFEINVISHEQSDYKISKKIFDDLWIKAKLLISKDNIGEFMDEVVKKIWIGKLPKPYLAYVRVLHELLYLPEQHIKYPSKITRSSFFDLEYQKDAIKESLDIIKKHNGVIVADVVGLGKSIVASAVAHNLNLQTIVICPPHLEKEWENYKREFRFNADVYKSGSIKRALDDYKNIGGEKLIIVDEAHKYRNELTDDYKYLQHLCSENKVMLLTATPFNNKPQDIFSMVKLFQIPARSTIRTVDNLSNKFRELVIRYKKIKNIEKDDEQKQEIQEVAQEIRSILDPLVIRRSRVDLDKISRYKQDLQKQGIFFPDVKPPRLLNYKLNELEEKYISTLENIIKSDDKRFIGARYKPTEYIKEEKKDVYSKEIEKMYGDKNLFAKSQSNIAKFMKRLLVHRFESSLYAFYSTLESILYSMRLIESWHEKVGKVPVYKKGNMPDADALFDTTSDDQDEQRKILDEKLEELKQDKGYWYLDKKDLKDEFIIELRHDIALLEAIKQNWFKDIPLGRELGFDPKIEEFRKELAEQLSKHKNRKIIVFSGYSDTAEYLYQKLKDDFRVFKYSSKEASDGNKEIIKNNFDAGVPQSEQKDDYDVLVATDAISEGFNLHRAGTVINFDIPYNPTRVIQRVGRINRVNKKVFDELFIYNYFPSLVGERETGVKRISTLKIGMINALLGADMRVLTEDEDIESYYQEQYKKAELDDNIESWDTKYFQEFEAVDKDVLRQAREIEKRTRLKRTRKKDKKGILVFAKKGNDYLFKLAEDEGHVLLSAPDAVVLFQATMSENAEPVSESFESEYQKLLATLFKKREPTKLDNASRDTIEKISALLNKFPSEKEYLDDLMYVMRDLESLSGQDAKYIRNIDVKKSNSVIKELKEQIPDYYLSGIIKKASQIEDGEESLIITEELI